MKMSTLKPWQRFDPSKSWTIPKLLPKPKTVYTTELPDKILGSALNWFGHLYDIKEHLSVARSNGHGFHDSNGKFVEVDATFNLQNGKPTFTFNGRVFLWCLRSNHLEQVLLTAFHELRHFLDWLNNGKPSKIENINAP